MAGTQDITGIIVKGFNQRNLKGLSGEVQDYIQYLKRVITKPFVEGHGPLEVSLYRTKAVRNNAGQVIFPASTKFDVYQGLDTFGGYGMTKEAAEMTVPEVKNMIRNIVAATKQGIKDGEIGA